MEEVLVGYNTAKLAKEKGFNWKVLDTFDDKGKPVSKYKLDEDGLESYLKTGDENYVKEVFELNNSQMQNDYVARPTQSLLQKWLRDENSISVKIDDCYQMGKITFYVTVSKLGPQKDNPSCFSRSYEKALENGLFTALKQL